MELPRELEMTKQPFEREGDRLVWKWRDGDGKSMVFIPIPRDFTSEEYVTWLESRTPDDVEWLLLRREGAFASFFPVEAGRDRDALLATLRAGRPPGGRAIHRVRRDGEVAAELAKAVSIARPPLTGWVTSVETMRLQSAGPLFCERLKALLSTNLEDPDQRYETTRLAEGLLELRANEDVAVRALRRIVETTVPRTYDAAWGFYECIRSRTDRCAPEAAQSWLESLRQSEDDEPFMIGWGLTSGCAEEAEWSRIEGLVKHEQLKVRARAIGALILGSHGEPERARAIWSPAIQAEDDREFRFGATASEIHSDLPLSFVCHVVADYLRSIQPDDRFAAANFLPDLQGDAAASLAREALDDEPDPYLRVVLEFLSLRSRVE
jgi:hypothetical protein